MSTKLDLKIGKKPVRAYITAVIVHLKTGGTEISIKARGRSISKAVDVAEIIKRFEETPIEQIGKIKIGTEEFEIEPKPNEKLDETVAVRGGYKRRVSTIEINMKLKVKS